MEKIVTDQAQAQAMLFIEDENIKQKIVEVLESLSYKATIISSIKDNTIDQVKSGSNKVIVLEDGFQNISFRENPIYQEIIRMTMPFRRNIFFVLLGNEIKYPEPTGAFSMSVNLLLDIGKIKEQDLGTILQQEIFYYTQLYQVYNMVKKQINQRGSYVAT